MPFLDAALAFALTMLAVSTVAGQLLDLARKALGLRARRMREMLEDFFASELRPVIDREMSRPSNRMDNEVRAAVEQVAAKLSKNTDARR